MLLRLLLSILLPIGFGACAIPASKPLIPENRYDKALNRYSGNYIYKNKLKTKHVQRLEKAFYDAQKYDLLKADSLLNIEQPDRWLYVHAYYKRIKGRQNSMANLMQKPVKDGPSGQWLLVADIEEKIKASKRAAADYLYAKAGSLLEDAVATKQKEPARQAWDALDNLHKNYFLHWGHSRAMMDSALFLGQTRILVELPDGELRQNASFWSNFDWGAKTWQKQWCRVSLRDTFTHPIDFRMRCRLDNLNIGWDNTSTSTRCETERVQVGTEEVKDTSGRVIERKPIYEDRTKTITIWTVTRDASGHLAVEVLSPDDGRLISSHGFGDSYHFSETSESSCPSSPSRHFMECRIADRIGGQLQDFLHKDLTNRRISSREVGKGTGGVD